VKYVCLTESCDKCVCPDATPIHRPEPPCPGSTDSAPEQAAGEQDVPGPV